MWCKGTQWHSSAIAALWLSATALSAEANLTSEPELAPDVDGQFEAWRLGCQSAAQTCQLTQSAAAGPGDADVFLFTLSPMADGHVAVMTVPTGVYLAPGMEMRIDSARPYKVLYEVCDGAGCHAGFRLTPEVLRGFKAGLEARIRIWTAYDRAVEVPISLRGFTAAFARYEQELSQ